MRAILLPWLAVAVGCSGRSDTKLTLTLSGTGLDSEVEPTIEMRAGETRILELVVVGAAEGPVTFTGNLPAFATMQGPLVTLAPGRHDEGDHQLAFTVTAGHDSASAMLHLTVLRLNQAPISSGPAIVRLTNGGGIIWRQEACPSSQTCTLGPEDLLMFGGCDPDGDSLVLDVEVVPLDQPFSKRPTYSATAPAVPPSNCASATIRLSGLTSGQPYRFATRVSDEFGAVASVPGSPDGWRADQRMAFQQGPCPTGPCACVSTPPPTSSEGGYCAVDLDCCSGSCRRPSPTDYPRCQ